MYVPIFPNRRGKSTKKNRKPLIFKVIISKNELFANTFEQKGKRQQSDKPVFNDNVTSNKEMITSEKKEDVSSRPTSSSIYL